MIPGALVASAEDIIRIHSNPTRDNLIQVFPNPMKDKATFSYELLAESLVEISIYNFQGQLIKTLPKEFWPAGLHKRSVDISDLDQGIYMYHFTWDNHSETGRIVVAY